MSVSIAVGDRSDRFPACERTKSMSKREIPMGLDMIEIAESFDLGKTTLERIAEGESAAVNDCLNRYGGLVWSLARKMFPNTADAEDATQDIFTEIWQRAATFDKSLSSETTFVAMIARRRLIDRFRRLQAMPSFVAEDVSELEIECNVTADRAELKDESVKASQCMEKLSSDQHKIIVMSVHHGVSHSSIAEKLTMPLGTVKSYARRALLQLRECMQRPAFSSAGREG
jgi:RNA polymerase sigma-70 factor, ECF subfamily